VVGNEAVVGGRAEPGSSLGSGGGFFFHVRDSGLPPTGSDLVRLELLGFVPTTCPSAELISPAAVTEGDIVVTDAQPCAKKDKNKNKDKC
jgi:hypothetical protein